MWGCSRGGSSPRSGPKAAPGVPYNDCQRPTTRPHRSRCCRDASRWRLDASRWRPGRPREWIWALNWCQNSGFYGFLAPSGLKSLRLARTAPKRDWPDGPKITTPSGAGTAPGGAKTVGFIVFGAPGGPGSQKNSGFYRFFGPKRPQEPPLSPETSDQGWAWPPLVSTQQNSWHRFGTTFFQILKISNSLQKKLIGNFWKIFELCNQSQKKL